MKSLLVLTATVLGAIGIGIGAVAATGQADIASSRVLAHGAGAQSLQRASGFCSEISSIGGAVVRRDVSIPQNHPHFSFPAVVRIEDVAAAKHVARVLCSLPKFPPGVYSCPVDLGISYNVAFSTGSSTATVSVNPWGCEEATGAISNRSTTAAMWHTLGAAMGLRHASRLTFAGKIKGA